MAKPLDPGQPPPEGGWLGFAYATSTDGLDWKYYTKNGDVAHVFDTDFSPASPSSLKWDYYGVETNSVVKKGGTYYMWYYGYPGLYLNGSVLHISAGRRDHIGLATSPDGITWTRHPSSPVLAPTLPWEQPGTLTIEEGGKTTKKSTGGVLEPSVLWDGSQFRMWYEGWTIEQFPKNPEQPIWYVGYATSPDGVTWTKEPTPVFQRSSNAEDWDAPPYGAGIPSVVQDPKKGCHLFYTAGGAKTTIGHAYSANCKDGWERDPNNPLIKQPTGETPPTDLYGQQAAVWKDGKIYLWVLHTKPGPCSFCGGPFDLYTADCPAS